MYLSVMCAQARAHTRENIGKTLPTLPSQSNRKSFQRFGGPANPPETIPRGRVKPPILAKTNDEPARSLRARGSIFGLGFCKLAVWRRPPFSQCRAIASDAAIEQRAIPLATVVDSVGSKKSI